MVGAPPRQCSPPKFESLWLVWGRLSWAGLGNFVFGVRPASRAAAVSISLKVEPGANSWSVASESSGVVADRRLSCFMAGRIPFWLWDDSGLGSYEGIDTRASTSPVRGSSAATA